MYPALQLRIRRKDEMISPIALRRNGANKPYWLYMWISKFEERESISMVSNKAMAVLLQSSYDITVLGLSSTFKFDRVSLKMGSG